MKTIRALSLACLSGVLFLSHALAAEPAASPDQRLVGVWQEYQPDSGVTEFLPDHSLRVYLTKEERGAQNTHWISGSWKIAPGPVLQMDLSAEGQSVHKEARLAFDKDELVLIDESKTEARHRRLSGELPEEYRW